MAVEDRRPPLQSARRRPAARQLLAAPDWLTLAPAARQHRSGQQLEAAGERQIEGRDRARADQRHIEQERRRRRASQPPPECSIAAGRRASTAAARPDRTAPRCRATTDAAAASWRIRRRNSRIAAAARYWPENAALAKVSLPSCAKASRQHPEPAQRSRSRRAPRSAPERCAGCACCRSSSRLKRPRSSSRVMMPVIRKPEITKNTSTPMKPPGMAFGKAWKCRTSITAMARRPSTSGRYFNEGEDKGEPTSG